MKLRSNRVVRGKRGIQNEDLTIMKLRSNRVLKRAKPVIQNQDSSDNLSNGENGGSEGEIEVCADDADNNVEMGMNDAVNVDVDDKGVFLGSEVLNPVVSCPKQDTEENESGHVDCEIDSIHVDCESGSENLDSGTGDKMVDDVGDGIKQTLSNGIENGNVLGKGRRVRRKKNVGKVKKNGFKQDKIDSEVRSLKLDRQTKRKIADRLDGRVKKGKVEKDEDPVSMRVLRSRTMTTISDGTIMVVDDGLRETVLGLKRLDDSIQLAGNDGHTMAVDGGLRETDLGLKRSDESIQLAGNDGHTMAVDGGLRETDLGLKRSDESIQLAGNDGHTMAVDGGLRETDLGLKRSDESIQLAGNDGHTMAVDGGLCETDFGLNQLDDSIQLAGNDRHKRKSKRHIRPSNIYVDENPIPNKKLKRHEGPPKIERRGRPRKIVPQDVHPEFPIERRGRPRKMVPQDVLPKFPIERRGRSRKIVPQDVLPKFPIERRGRPRKIVPQDVLPKFPIERRGRPRKTERRGRSRKIVPQDVLPNFRIERRGRPRKIVPRDVQVGPTQLRVETMSPGVKDLIPKKLKNRRREPNKREAKTLAKYVLKMRTAKPEVQRKETIEGEENGEPRKTERRGRPRKIVPQDVLPKFRIERRGRPRKIVPQDVQVGPTKLRVETMSPGAKDLIPKKLKKRRREPIKREAKSLAKYVLNMRTAKPEIQRKETIEGEENGKHLARYDQKHRIREKITDMLLKSGWTIDFKQRGERTTLDAIYTEPNRKRAHWSTTKAYAMLKKKIEEGKADDNEISAYYPIPQEEISMLFRHSKKKLGDEEIKNRRRKKRVSKGKIVTNKKKRVFKKAKNGAKKKHGKKITGRSKPRLLARGSEKGSQKDNNGGLVTKHRNLLSFMIDSGVISVGSKVQYGKKKKNSYEGTITSDGICCDCCNEVMGISEFVSHFGGITSQGFDNVYLESGTCLRKCLVDSWRREEELNSSSFDVVVDVKGDDRNDEACNICCDGGDLICCDSCPSAFHQSCLDIQNFPSGDWNCNFCCCKFCGVLSVTIPQVDDSSDAVASEMLSCCLCEDKFHLSCLQEVVDIESNGRSFCGRKCQELFKQLQTYLGVKHELEDGFSWTLLQRSDIDQDLTVHDGQLKVEQNSKLAVAFSVMDECFLPITDRRSGTNMIQNVVYNCSSNFKRLNYSGFVTAVLEKGDELITVASIRVHGYGLAEMPFIGTRQMYRRQGMCRRLLDAIESCLSVIGVEELIIPAIPELLQTWTKVFGFMPSGESLKQAMKCMSMIVFPGIDMLKKPLHQNRAVNANSCPSTASDVNIVECNNKQNDENDTQLEIMSSKERDGKDVIDHEQTREDVIDIEQTEEPVVTKPVDAAEDVNGVSDYKQTEEVLMDCGSCLGVKNDKLVTPESAEGLCDLNFPLSNGGPCDTDGQVDAEPFQDYTNGPTSMDFMTSEVKVKLSPPTSELVPKNTFDLNLQPTAVEIDMNILGDDCVQCRS